jgi:hypothetical protein
VIFNNDRQSKRGQTKTTANITTASFRRRQRRLRRREFEENGVVNDDHNRLATLENE